jgi:hypothetical protein
MRVGLRGLENRVVVVSPELVLVSSPEDAALARSMLPEFVFPVPRREAAPSRLSAAIFEAVCVAATVGPLALIILAR